MNGDAQLGSNGEEKFQANSGTFIAKLDQDLAELSNLLSKSNGYQVTISTYNSKTKKLSHNLITNSFPRVDMIDSYAECKVLVDKQHEKSRSSEG